MLTAYIKKSKFKKNHYSYVCVQSININYVETLSIKSLLCTETVPNRIEVNTLYNKLLNIFNYVHTYKLK